MPNHRPDILKILSILHSEGQMGDEELLRSAVSAGVRPRSFSKVMQYLERGDYVRKVEPTGYDPRSQFVDLSKWEITRSGTSWLERNRRELIPAEAASFASVIEKFLGEAEDAVAEWEARMSGEPSLADTYGQVASAAERLRELSGGLEAVRRALAA